MTFSPTEIALIFVAAFLVAAVFIQDGVIQRMTEGLSRARSELASAESARDAYAARLDTFVYSDMKKVDAYVLGPADYEEIPEITEEMFREGVWHFNGKPRGPRKS